MDVESDSIARELRQARIGFVIPRCGDDIGGGAETLVTLLAEQLVRQGVRAEILSTCAKDNRTWANHYAPGVDLVRGVPVRRFLVSERNLERWVPLQIRIADGLALTVEEQLEWMEHSVTSASLFQHLREEGKSYDALYFAPYLFGTTFWGSLIHPERSYLIPCFHDEPYAYLDIIQSMCRQVRGMVFNAREEMQFAQQLYGSVRGGEVGMGFVPHAPEYLASSAPYFEDQAPYILYVGRKETGKNAHILVDYFIEAKRSGALPQELKLVVAGGGSFEDLHRPHAKGRSDIVDIPHTSEDQKVRLMRHAVVLCQPSRNESFSIVLMEAWLAGTAVLVNGFCPVTRGHVIASGGGLYFAGQEDFNGTVRALLESRELRQQLATAGARYVETKYSWPAVLARFSSLYVSETLSATFSAD